MCVCVCCVCVQTIFTRQDIAGFMVVASSLPLAHKEGLLAVLRAVLRCGYQAGMADADASWKVKVALMQANHQITISQLDGQVKNLQAALQASQADLVACQQQLQQERAQAEHAAQQRSHQWQERTAVLDRDLQRTRFELATCQQQLDKCRHELHSMGISLQAEQQRAGELQARLQSWETTPAGARVQSLESELQDVYAQTNSLREQLWHANMQVEQIRAQQQHARAEREAQMGGYVSGLGGYEAEYE